MNEQQYSNYNPQQVAQNYPGNEPEQKKNKTLMIIAALLGVLVIIAGAMFLFGGGGNAIPDVTDEDQATAEKMLTDSEFVVGTVTKEYSDEVEEGLVISTNPAAGVKADAGTKVNLVVSKGPEDIEVPNVVGMTEDEAIKAFTEAGLKYENGGKVFSEKHEAGLVAKTSPKAGEKVKAEDGKVTFYISKGTGTINLKDVLINGQPQATAKKNLVNLGLKVTISKEYSDSVDKGTVIRYETSNGTNKVKSGDTVTLYVSKGKKPEPTPTPTPEPDPEEPED